MNGNTELHEAFLKTDVNKIKNILKINPNAINVKNDYGTTPFMYLNFKYETKGGSFEQQLKEFNLHQHLILYITKYVLSKKEVDINIQNNTGTTMLMFACIANNLEVIKELSLHPSLDLTLKDLNNRTVKEYCSPKLFKLITSKFENYTIPEQKLIDYQTVDSDLESMNKESTNLESTNTETNVKLFKTSYVRFLN